MRVHCAHGPTCVKAAIRFVVHIYPHGLTIRCLMATKARHLKTPVQLWIGDKRREFGLIPRDIAALTGVSEDTARGWESRGRPSQEALAILERRFGEAAPPERNEYVGNLAELSSAVRELIVALRELVAEIRRNRLSEPAVDVSGAQEAGFAEGLRRGQTPPIDAAPDTPSPSPGRPPRGSGAGRG
jgi:hypothetical protein